MSETPNDNPSASQTPPVPRQAFRVLRRQRRKIADPALHPVPGEGRRTPASFYIFPNIFTSASLFLALFSMTKAAEGIVVSVQGGDPSQSFVIACWAILLAAVCDAIDGPVARLTRTSSPFGLHYDSLADVVAFGVAPAFLMFANLRTMDPAALPDHAPKLALGACSLFAICSAIRLARFNVQAHTTEKRFFSGLPSPGAAGTVVTAYLFIEWVFNLPFVIALEDSGWIARMLHRSILLLMVGLAILMVSEIPFPKIQNMFPLRQKPINMLVVIVVIVCIMIAFSFYVPVFLFGCFLLYIGGSIFAALRRRKPEAAKEPA